MAFLLLASRSRTSVDSAIMQVTIKRPRVLASCREKPASLNIDVAKVNLAERTPTTKSILP
jgi:hypothetical protein